MRLVGVALLAKLAAPPPLMTALQKIDGPIGERSATTASENKHASPRFFPPPRGGLPPHAHSFDGGMTLLVPALMPQFPAWSKNEAAVFPLTAASSLETLAWRHEYHRHRVPLGKRTVDLDQGRPLAKEQLF